MACALGTLVDNLDKDNCKNLRKFYKGEKFELLKRKGVYPYDYMDSLEKLSDNQLPSKEGFYLRLNNTKISDEDYQHTQNVWEKFDMKSMREYHDLYLKSDVLLLADVFKNFRDVCQYGLDPFWYYTSPGLSWDALLKTTNIYFENIKDPDMYLFFQKGTRGGISTITTRHGEVNNLYMGDEYDPEKPMKYITYLDANNLYGWAMSNPLPTGGFKWMEEKELGNWRNVPCTVEVDLEYPKELHNAHNEYPLTAERLVVGKVEKLIPSLTKKRVRCEPQNCEMLRETQN